MRQEVVSRRWNAEKPDKAQIFQGGKTALPLSFANAQAAPLCSGQK
jgi:hypothetical protein